VEPTLEPVPDPTLASTPKPTPEKKPELPKTGDGTNVTILFGMLALSMAGVTLMAIKRKKNG